MNTLEAKKPPQPIATPKAEQASLTSSKVIDFIGDVKGELKKINWPNPDELRTYTKVVVGTAFALGVGIYIIDLLIQSCLNGLSLLIYWIS